MNKKRWYFFAESNRKDGKIVACYTESDRLDKVALLFCSEHGYCKLYPVYYKGLDTIEKQISIPVHNYITTRKIQKFKEN
ncbi:MAG: hypothetical protein J6A96_00980 [Clostridia bacterium]|nr:hypothetical protein [Clostridia bacterium]